MTDESHLRLSELLARSDDVILMDGGTGGCLEDRGVDVRNALWSSAALFDEDGRALTRALHRDYVDAGARVVIANTHNVGLEACRAFLQDVGLPDAVRAAPASERAQRLLEWLERTGVDVLRDALQGTDAVTAAGIGTEEPWARSTTRSVDEIAAAHRPCAAALRGRATILFEALSTPEEIGAVARVARELALDDFGIALTCGPDGKTWAGVTMRSAVAAFDRTAPTAFFIQCTRFDTIAPALDELVAALDGHPAVAGAYGNDGRTWQDHRWHGERVSPIDYADAAAGWIDAGARIVGGCCGTTPEHIRELGRRFPASANNPATTP